MHHSPSSYSTAQQCELKWFYDRTLPRPLEVTWAQIEAWGKDWQKHCTPRQRSTARGTAVHELFEAYYGGREVDWASPIGQIALSGRAYLPHREACLEIRIERSIGDTPYPRDDDPDRTALMVDGTRWLGYVDLEVRLDPDGAEARRLGIVDALRQGDGWYTFDYKTSKNVDQYALTPEEALVDPQGILYPVAGMERTGARARGMRWVYMQTENRSYAKPVDTLVTYEHGKAHLATMVERARELEKKTSVELCVPNTDACDNYGGCQYHVSKGGPCTARRPLGRMLPMGFKDMYKKKQEAAGAASSAAPTETPAGANGPAPSDAPTEAAADVNTTVINTALPPAEKPAVAPPAKAKAAKASAPAAGSTAATLADLVKELAEAEATVTRVKAAIKEACG